MQQTGLRAVVIGAGWAGEGHTKALQYNGVTVEAICARNQAVVQNVAERLGVSNASVDWRKTLHELKPDIVTIATPASLRREIVEEAVALGCHILCEKPLAANATEAQALYQLAQEADICHAYGTNHAYEPGAAWVSELIDHGAIGKLREIHLIQVVPFLSTYKPWTWWERTDMGGGTLNNGGTHLFAIVERIMRGKIMRATGTARTLRQQAPVVPGIHDFRQLFADEPSADEVATLEWRHCDTDHSFTALLECNGSYQGESERIPIMLHSNFAASSLSPANGWYFYGDDGLLIGQGGFSFTVAKQVGSERTALPTPQRLLDKLPQTGDDGQNKWHALAADFVADILSKHGKSYPTFEDGWRYQEMIDAIRTGQEYLASE